MVLLLPSFLYNLDGTLAAEDDRTERPRLDRLRAEI